MMRRKQIVIRDKEKIIAVIEELDKKKKEALRLAWKKVNKDFGSIFSSLLPGAQAELKPPDGKDILDGLEVSLFTFIYLQINLFCERISIFFTGEFVCANSSINLCIYVQVSTRLVHEIDR